MQILIDSQPLRFPVAPKYRWTNRRPLQCKRGGAAMMQFLVMLLVLMIMVAFTITGRLRS